MQIAGSGVEWDPQHVGIEAAWVSSLPSCLRSGSPGNRTEGNRAHRAPHAEVGVAGVDLMNYFLMKGADRTKGETVSLVGVTSGSRRADQCDQGAGPERGQPSAAGRLGQRDSGGKHRENKAKCAETTGTATGQSQDGARTGRRTAGEEKRVRKRATE